MYLKQFSTLCSRNIFSYRQQFPKLKCFVRTSPTSQLFMHSDSTIEVDEKYMINVTKLWVEKFVINHKLCPWAAKTIIDKKLLIIVLKSTNKRQLIDEITLQSQIFINNIISPDRLSPSTVILVFPKKLSFQRFLSFHNKIEELFQMKNFDKYLQIATFHPDYMFQDSTEDSVENWTNRSPYAMFHLLNIDEVSKGINNYTNQHGSTDSIWANNIEKMKLFGLENILKQNELIIKEAKLLTEKENQI